LVAGTAAYLRGLESPWKEQLKNPKNLKALIKLLQRQVQTGDSPMVPEFARVPANKKQDKVPTLWNGQNRDRNCLQHADDEEMQQICPNIDDMLRPDADKRLNSPTSNSNTHGGAIQFHPGPPGPLCPGGGASGLAAAKRALEALVAGGETCGKLCTGFYCKPNPAGHPPDFHDPEDPKYKTSTGTAPRPTAAPDAELDAGNACNCNGLTCDKNSPDCCQTFTCPTCKCHESQCDPGAAACCAHSTCQWDSFLWTSGRKGTCRVHIKEEHRQDADEVKLTLRSYLNDDRQRSETTATVKWNGQVEWMNGPGSQRNRLAEGIRIEVPSRRMRFKREEAATAAISTAMDTQQQRPRPDPGEGNPPGRTGENTSYQSWDLVITGGETKWTTADRDESKKPFCRVGNWNTLGGTFEITTVST